MKSKDKQKPVIQVFKAFLSNGEECLIEVDALSTDPICALASNILSRNYIIDEHGAFIVCRNICKLEHVSERTIDLN